MEERIDFLLSVCGKMQYHKYQPWLTEMFKCITESERSLLSTQDVEMLLENVISEKTTFMEKGKMVDGEEKEYFSGSIVIDGEVRYGCAVEDDDEKKKSFGAMRRAMVSSVFGKNVTEVVKDILEDDEDDDGGDEVIDSLPNTFSGENEYDDKDIDRITSIGGVKKQEQKPKDSHQRYMKNAKSVPNHGMNCGDIYVDAHCGVGFTKQILVPSQLIDYQKIVIYMEEQSKSSYSIHWDYFIYLMYQTDVTQGCQEFTDMLVHHGFKWREFKEIQPNVILSHQKVKHLLTLLTGQVDVMTSNTAQRTWRMQQHVKMYSSLCDKNIQLIEKKRDKGDAFKLMLHAEYENPMNAIRNLVTNGINSGMFANLVEGGADGIFLCYSMGGEKLRRYTLPVKDVKHRKLTTAAAPITHEEMTLKQKYGIDTCLTLTKDDSVVPAEVDEKTFKCVEDVVFNVTGLRVKHNRVRACFYIQEEGRVMPDKIESETIRQVNMKLGNKYGVVLETKTRVKTVAQETIVKMANSKFEQSAVKAQILINESTHPRNERVETNKMKSEDQRSYSNAVKMAKVANKNDITPAQIKAEHIPISMIKEVIEESTDNTVKLLEEKVIKLEREIIELSRKNDELNNRLKYLSDKSDYLEKALSIEKMKSNDVMIANDANAEAIQYYIDREANLLDENENMQKEIDYLRRQISDNMDMMQRNTEMPQQISEIESTGTFSRRELEKASLDIILKDPLLSQRLLISILNNQ